MSSSCRYRWIQIWVLLLSSAALSAQSAAREERALLAAAEQQPANAHAAGAVGSFYFREKKWDLSAAWFGKAYALSNGDATIGLDLVLAMIEAGSLDQASQQIGKMEARQDAPKLHSLMAEIDDRRGAYRDAALEYRRAAEMEPTDDHIFDLATYLVQHKQYVGALDDAIKFYRYGVQQFPRSARMHVGLGVALYAANQYDEAIRVLCEAVDLDPRDPRPFQFLGRASRVSSDLAASVDNRLKGFVQHYPENAAANYFYALALWERGGTQGRDMDEIESLLRKAETRAPQWYEPHYQLGVVLESEHKYTDALIEMRRAVGIDADFFPAHYRLATLYNRQGQKAKAEAEVALVRELKAKSEDAADLHDVSE